MEKKLKGPLKKAVRFLENSQYHYALIGGIALSQWGVVRVTRDIDFKILVPDYDYNSIREKIKEAFPHPARQNLPGNPLIISVSIDEVIVDFLLAIPGYEQQIINRAVRKKLNGLNVWVCSVEDLIIQKAVAGRGRDWPDIEALIIEQRGKLDEVYINNWLTQFSEVLENPKILDEYKRLQKKIEDLEG